MSQDGVEIYNTHNTKLLSLAFIIETADIKLAVINYSNNCNRDDMDVTVW
jgi:hypothetical protein